MVIRVGPRIDGPVKSSQPARTQASQTVVKASAVTAPKPTAPVVQSPTPKATIQAKPASTSTPAPIVNRQVNYTPASVQATKFAVSKPAVETVTANRSANPSPTVDVRVGKDPIPAAAGKASMVTVTKPPSSHPQSSNTSTSKYVELNNRTPPPATSFATSKPSQPVSQAQATKAQPVNATRTDGLAEAAQFATSPGRTAKASPDPAPDDSVAGRYTPTREEGRTPVSTSPASAPAAKQPPPGLNADERTTYRTCEELERQNLPLIPQCGFASQERWGPNHEEERINQLAAKSTINGKLNQDLFYQNLREEQKIAAKNNLAAYVPDPGDVSGIAQGITSLAGAIGGAAFRPGTGAAAKPSQGATNPVEAAIAQPKAVEAEAPAPTRGQELKERYGQLTGEQRAEVIAAKTDSNYRRLAEEMDTTYGAHTNSIHGPGTTVEQQVDRASTGMKPDGVQGPKVNSSRFASYEVLVNAVQKATAQRNPNIMANPVTDDVIYVNLEREAGTVWEKKTGKELGATTRVIVRFDAITDAPYTAYPIK